jgi:hypothetical protein
MLVDPDDGAVDEGVLEVEVSPGATHETLKILFQENPDVGDTFSAGKNKLWIAVRLPSGSCEEDQKP